MHTRAIVNKVSFVGFFGMIVSQRLKSSLRDLRKQDEAPLFRISHDILKHDHMQYNAPTRDLANKRHRISEFIRFNECREVSIEHLKHLGHTKAKSRKYQGVFEVKSRVKAWQVRGIWSPQLEH